MDERDEIEYRETIARRVRQLGIVGNPPIWEPSQIVPEDNVLPRDIDNPPRGVIRLHEEDIEEVKRGAHRLQRDAVNVGARNTFGCPPGEELQKHRIGALGELALARAFGVPWRHQSGTFGRTPDVEGWQVRTRAGLDDLCLRRCLKDLEGAFMLVQVVHWPYVLNIAGWSWGIDAHQIRWQQSKDGGSLVYFIPACKLHDKHFMHYERITDVLPGPRERALPKYLLEVLED